MNVKIFFHNVEVTSVEKILKNLDVAKASKMNQISTKVLKDDTPVIVTYLSNFTNLFLRNARYQKQNPCLKKELRLKLRIVCLFLDCP